MFDHKYAGVKLGYRNFEDWYKISQDDIFKHGGGPLILKHYSNSPCKLITSTYLNYDWKMWKFSKVPEGFWDQMENHERFVDWLGINYKYFKLSFISVEK